METSADENVLNGNVSQEKLPNQCPSHTAEQQELFNFESSSWKSLPSVALTSLALKEIDRQADAEQVFSIATHSGDLTSIDLTKFASNGGPDLCHLLGFAENRLVSETMKKQDVIGFRKKAHNKTFESHLGSHGIHMDDFAEKPNNINAISAVMSRREFSSVSDSSESEFKEFQAKDARTFTGQDVWLNILRFIPGDSKFNSSSQCLFTDIDLLTPKKLVNPQPDLFDGTNPLDISDIITQDPKVASKIVPTKHFSTPVVPNFFMDIKAPQGEQRVAERQACYVGALGARAMHTIQNYGATEQTYDGNAYTFSAIYQFGILKLFAHYSKAPVTTDGGPTYHMARLGCYALTGDYESFVQGVSAVRNLRQLAKKNRDAFIQAANARAAS